MKSKTNEQVQTLVEKKQLKIFVDEVDDDGQWRFNWIFSFKLNRID